MSFSKDHYLIEAFKFYASKKPDHLSQLSAKII